MKAKYIRLLVIAIIFVMAAGAAANEYVSLNGKFKFTYPDDWEQMDYNTVDVFLASRKASKESYKYEAVFSPKSNSPFYDGNYLILTVDKIGPLDSAQTDSALNEMGHIFGNEVKYYPQGDYTANLKSNTPYFDRAHRVAKVINEINEPNQPFKKNLLVYKFYDQGIARFYFYSPDSMFDASLPVFNQMVASFSTDSLDEALPKGKVKISDVDTSSKDSGGTNWVPYYGLAIIIIVLLVARRRKKRASKSE